MCACVITTHIFTDREALLETGKVRNIGLSNFTKSEVENVLKSAVHKPDFIQLEIHPCTSIRLDILPRSLIVF